MYCNRQLLRMFQEISLAVPIDGEFVGIDREAEAGYSQLETVGVQSCIKMFRLSRRHDSDQGLW